jgi:hypothetical protein
VHSKTKKSATSRVGHIALPFVAAALLLSVGFVRLRSEFDLLVTLDHLSFEVDNWGTEGARSLFEPTDMPLQIAAFRGIDLGNGILTSRPESGSTPSLVGRPRPTTVVPIGNLPSVRFDHAALHSLNISSGARVTLDWRRESPTQHALTISLSQESGEDNGSVELLPQANLDCNSCGAIRLWPQNGQALTDSGIDLRESQRVQTFQLKGDKIRSSIVAEGRLTFTSLGQQIPIAQGDFLVAENVRGASITTVSVENGIRINVRGVADSMRVGSRSESLSERQPTLFEYVTSRKNVTTYYTGIGLLGSIVLSVLARLGNTNSKD